MKVIDESLNLPTLAGIREAARLISGYAGRTPLVRSHTLSKLMSADVWIKNETVSPIASFKLRGALAEVLRINQDKNIKAVVTSSTGNHGQGVAYAAKIAGLASHIFLPENPNQVKRAAIETLGAVIHEAGADIDYAKVDALRFAREHEYTFVDDGETLGVMHGAGTVGLEIAEALSEIDAVVVPMGSGTLASGSAAAIKGLQPGVRVFAVQAKGSPAMVESFKARRAIERPVETIAEGLACREPATLALKALLALVDEADLVSDDELLAGIHALASAAHVLVEPAGAAAFAGAWNRRSEFKGKRIVLVLTGANISMDTLREALRTNLPFS